MPPKSIATVRFDYPLAARQIAQHPAAQRAASRLLVVDQRSDGLREFRFAQLAKILRPGDLLVGNDTRVLPARLFAQKSSGGKVEIMLERLLDTHAALVQLRANKPIRVPAELGCQSHTLRVSARRGDFFVLRARTDIAELFHVYGRMPLPPYITRAVRAEDFERYQTVYARTAGAVAAPTAGLHFTQALIQELGAIGIGWANITLHVGAGTYQPIRAKNVATHTMHREWIEVDARACAQINAAKQNGARVIAIGTTVIRALESAAQFSRTNALQPFRGDTELFILPGFRFRVADALLTNFHLPRSTLLMLVCAFAGYERVMRAYFHAARHDFRFYSYGDAMFVAHEPDLKKAYPSEN